MSAAETFYPYLGVGKIHGRIAGTTDPMLYLGMANKLEYSVKANKQKIQDSSKPGGGVYASVSRIESVTASMNFMDLNTGNIARALFGTASAVAAGVMPEKTVIAHKGALIPLDHIDSTLVVLTNSAGTTTYDEDVDYEVQPGGVYIIPAGAITDAQSIKLSCSHGAFDKIEGITTSAPVLELRFVGENEASGGRPFIFDAYKMQLDPAKALALLSDKFAELPVEAELLADPTKTGAGLSKYLKIIMAKPAA